MLLQTNSYIVPKDKRSEHARLLRKFRATLQRLGADQLEVYEQVGANWAQGEATGRFVQIMRFRDRKHQQAVQAAERQDPVAQQLIQEFCALINFPYQQQQGLFAVGFYTSAIPVAAPRSEARAPQGQPEAPAGGLSAAAAGATAAAAGAADAAPAGEPAGSPVSPGADAPAAEQGSSMLDFSALSSPGPDDGRPPLRLTSDTDEIIESELGPADQGAAEPAPFSDTPEAMLDLVHNDTDEPLTDEDRDAVLGELTGDDAGEEQGDDAGEEQARRQKAES